MEIFSITGKKAAKIFRNVDVYGSAWIFVTSDEIGVLNPEEVLVQTVEKEPAGHGGYDLQQAAEKWAIDNRQGGNFKSTADCVKHAFIAGAAWAKERHKRTVDPTVYTGEDTVMRKLDGLIDAVAGLNGSIGRAIVSTGHNFELMHERIISKSDFVFDAVLDVGQKVEAVLDQVTPHDVAGPDPMTVEDVTAFREGVEAAYAREGTVEEERDHLRAHVNALTGALRTQEHVAAFWRVTARSRTIAGDLMKEQIMQMGDLIDNLTGDIEKRKD